MDQSARPIEKLSPEVVGQIAAGEVVERPASAIKELVENSIDAGATAITVEIREGGVAYLRVSDNGKGIPASQIRMAFERHATSKITRPEDLHDIHTLGFRGEALFSIAAVSKVTLTTRTAAEDFGVRAQVEAGRMVDVREAATPVGTTILVQELFFNTPVRLKFLKKPGLEAGFVSDYMLRLILSRPDIAFRFVNQGKTVYQSVGDGNLQSALFCVYGKEAVGQLKKVRGVQSGLMLEGYVGVGELSRGNRQQQSFFVNGRFCRDAGLSRALENACQGLVMIGKFPVCALSLQMPCQLVDVNVHPNKLEVRFQDAPAVCKAVEDLVRDALQAEKLGDRLMGRTVEGLREEKAEASFVVVPLKEEGAAEEKEAEKEAAKEPPETPAPMAPTGESLESQLKQLDPVVIPARQLYPSLREMPAPPMNARPMPPPALPGREAAQMAGWEAPARVVSQATPKPVATPPEAQPEPEQETLFKSPDASDSARAFSQETPAFRRIGVAFQTYWLFEAGERLLWVDQHAAHERILYDKLWKQYEGEHISQRLLTPQLVRVTAQECALAEELAPLLEEAGFEVRPFDETAVSVHAIPTIFGRNENPKELLTEALDQWQAGRGQSTRERMRKQVIQMACKKAIKAGDKLSEAELDHLLSQMLESGVPPTCPHGRPIVVEVTQRDMEKRFKRIQ